MWSLLPGVGREIHLVSAWGAPLAHQAGDGARRDRRGEIDADQNQWEKEDEADSEAHRGWLWGPKEVVPISLICGEQPYSQKTFMQTSTLLLSAMLLQ